MNKRGQEGETILAWSFLFILLIMGLYGLLSSNYCDRLLLVVVLFALLWLFFGEPVLTQSELRGFKVFMPLCIVVFIIWILLKVTGICMPISDMLRQLIP